MNSSTRSIFFSAFCFIILLAMSDANISAGTQPSEFEKADILLVDENTATEDMADFKAILDETIYLAPVAVPEIMPAPEAVQVPGEDVAMLMPESGAMPRQCKFRKGASSLAMNGVADCM